MDIVRAREIIRILADGIDPTTGEVLPAESVCNSPEVIRALFVVLDATESKKRFHSQRAGAPWTDAEDEQLRNEFLSGTKSATMAKEHSRTRGAIESRLKHLGLQ